MNFELIYDNYLMEGWKRIYIYRRANYEDIHCELKCIHVLNALRNYEIANRVHQSKYWINTTRTEFEEYTLIHRNARTLANIAKKAHTLYLPYP